MHVEESGDDLYAAIDAFVRQAGPPGSKYKQKVQDHHRGKTNPRSGWLIFNDRGGACGLVLGATMNPLTNIPPVGQVLRPRIDQQEACF